jgi:hypothetical protein
VLNLSARLKRLQIFCLEATAAFRQSTNQTVADYRDGFPAGAFTPPTGSAVVINVVKPNYEQTIELLIQQIFACHIPSPFIARMSV